ncbi:MAG TPA: class I SAM-dependent methyltransferase [Saprospiraceae bacterium]|nr:class I SAM-dependent methyltransferase [Saprospiraceae bacterium]
MDNTQRFSDRVDHYVKNRPGYPAALLPLLAEKMGLLPSWTLADIGSGTGLSARPFLENGNRVFAVEPNAPMRAAAESWLNHFAGFHSLDGTAEHTTLPENSIDLIVCAQAFHWFDREKAAAEFERIRRPKGQTLLLWNYRDQSDPFQRAYDRLLAGNIENYAALVHRNVTVGQIEAFLSPRPVATATLPYHQMLDLDGLKGRLLSSSYAPGSGPAYERIIRGLEELFGQFSSSGQVRFQYQTCAFWG